MSAEPTAPPVTLTRSGPFLLISPLVPLIGALRVGRQEPAGAGGTDLVLTEQALFGFRRTIHDEQQTIVWAGLEPIVRGLLTSRNVPFTNANIANVAVGMGGGDSTANAGSIADSFTPSSITRAFSTNMFMTNMFSMSMCVTNMCITSICNTNMFSTSMCVTNMFSTSMCVTNMFSTSICNTNMCIMNMFSTSICNTNGAFTTGNANADVANAASGVVNADRGDTGMSAASITVASTATSGPGTNRGFGGTRTDPSIAAALTDPAVGSFVAGVPRGLVRHGAAVDVLRLIAELCVAFANKNANKKVVVIARTRAAAGRLDRLLIELGVEAALITGRHHDEPRRVTVCTLGATGRAGIERADVILVEDALHSTWIDPLDEPLIPHEIFQRPNPPDATGRDPRMPPAVGLMDRLTRTKTSAVVIGFLPRARHLSPFERVRVWQIYGIDELVVPRHGVVERPVVTVVTNRLNLRRSIPAGADEVAAKKALWHDPLRNRLRTKLARALKEGNRHLLMTFSGVLDAQTDTTPKAVLLLCEGIDQAQAIRKRFLDWPLVSGLDDSAGDVAAAVANPAGGVIATALGAEKLSGGKFDVVVRCDPGRGLPPLPPGWLETDDPNPRPLLVADVADEGHHLPALWSRMRKRAGLAAGWARAGADPDVTAWERFKARVLDREERP